MAFQIWKSAISNLRRANTCNKTHRKNSSHAHVIPHVTIRETSDFATPIYGRFEFYLRPCSPPVPQSRDSKLDQTLNWMINKFGIILEPFQRLGGVLYLGHIDPYILHGVHIIKKSLVSACTRARRAHSRSFTAVNKKTEIIRKGGGAHLAAPGSLLVHVGSGRAQSRSFVVVSVRARSCWTTVVINGSARLSSRIWWS